MFTTFTSQKAFTSGTFLFRKKADGKPGFVLSVCYRSKPTHHMITQSAKGKDYQVGKTIAEGVRCSFLAVIYYVPGFAESVQPSLHVIQ
jgi:hypothetical protein